MENEAEESELNANMMELPAYSKCNQILWGKNPADEMEDRKTSLDEDKNEMVEADFDEPTADEETHVKDDYDIENINTQIPDEN